MRDEYRLALGLAEGIWGGDAGKTRRQMGMTVAGIGEAVIQRIEAGMVGSVIYWTRWGRRRGALDGRFGSGSLVGLPRLGSVGTKVGAEEALDHDQLTFSKPPSTH